MAGDEVQPVQERLDELGFSVGEIDGQFGNLFAHGRVGLPEAGHERAPRRGSSILTDEMWQDMQRPIRVEPRRWHSEGQTTRNHTEIYLPSSRSLSSSSTTRRR